MTKKLFLSLSLVLFCLTFVNAQWNGNMDKEITITDQPNSSIEIDVELKDTLKIKEDILDVSCSVSNNVLLKATDTSDGLSVSICGTTKTYKYIAGVKVFITMGQNRLTFIKKTKI